ncbi:MAG TPA: O-antigen ligase family protein [Candidatus Hydrogenedentes bacterium]|nr:O-antigen ligase family protein [Candidatus Hydrogenedentota bacterium]
MTAQITIRSRILQLQRVVIGAWVVLLILALFPYTSDPAAPIKYLITGVAVLVMAVLWIASMVVAKEDSCIASPFFILLAVFLAVNTLAALLSGFPANSLNALRPWIMFSLIALFAAHAYREWQDIQSLLILIVVAVTLASIYGFCQASGLDPFPWITKGVEEYKGLPSTFANPNFAGHTLVIAVLLALGLLWDFWPNAGKNKSPSSSWTRWIPAGAVLVALAFMGSHLYLTRMRGGRIALVAAALFLFVYSLLRKRLRVLPAGVAAAVTLTLLGALGAGAVLTGAGQVKEDPAVPMDSSLVLRLNGYQGACRMFLDHPVLGIGIGNYAVENMAYWTPYEKRWFITEGKKNYHVHCDVLEAGIDAGVPGSAVYLALMIWGVLASLSLTASKSGIRRFGYILTACFAAFTVDGLFGFNLRVPVSAGLFFLLIGVLEGARDNAAKPFASPTINIGLAAALVVLAGLCTVFEVRSFLGERYYQRANGAQYWAGEAAKKGDSEREKRLLQAGYEILNKSRRFLPWDARMPEAQGQIDLKLRRPEQAIARFSEALQRHPNHSGIFISLAQAHINRALSCISETGGKNPLEYAPFVENLDRAKAAGQRAVTLCEGLPEAYEAMGRAEFLRAAALGEVHKDASTSLEEAEKQLTTALRYGTPNRASVQRILGQLYVKLKRPDDAERYFMQATESDPADKETWRLFQLFTKQQKRLKGYMDSLSRTYGLLKGNDPLDADTFTFIAGRLAENYAAAQNSRSLAEQLINDALGRLPYQFELWGVYDSLQPPQERLANLQNAWKKQTGADIPPLMPAIAEMDPANSDSMQKKLRILSETVEKRLKEVPQEQCTRELGWLVDLVITQVESASLPPEVQAALLAHCANICYTMGRWEITDRVLTRSLPLLPAAEQAQGQAIRSEALAHLKRLDEALLAAQEAVRLAPNSASMRWNLARRLVAAGRYAEAKFEYVSILQNTAPASTAYAKIKKELEELERKSAASAPAGSQS